jgi:hypothetical protein
VNGYYLRQCEDGLSRYLSTSENAPYFYTPTENDTSIRHHDTSLEKPGENDVFQSDTINERVTLKKSENPSNSGPCADVSTRDPENSTVEKNKGIGEGLYTYVTRGQKGRKVRRTDDSPSIHPWEETA